MKFLNSVFIVCLLMTSLCYVTTRSLPLDNVTESVCSKPASLKNGVYLTDVNMTTVEYACRPHYALVGSRHAYCKDGQWSAPTPICLGDDCKELNIKEATTYSSHGGGLLVFQCRRGFTLRGPNILACFDGQWNGTQPECISENDPNIQRDGKQNAFVQKHYKNEASENEIEKLKRSHEEWLDESDYSCIKTDDAVLPPRVPNARAFTQWAIVQGAPRLYTTYQCKWGYISTGIGKRMYCSKGQWIGAPPKCQPVTSSNDDDDVQGDVFGSGTGKAMTHAELLHFADYSCIGGTLEDSVEPPEPEHAIAALKFAVVNGKPHLYVKYSCEEGYFLQDASRNVMYCKKKRWIGERPACIPESEAAVGDVCQRNNGGCDQLCRVSDDGGYPLCECKLGYLLAYDGRTCHDLDECSVNNAGCAHICDNVDGGFECRCYDGFQLDTDLLSCIRSAEPEIAEN